MAETFSGGTALSSGSARSSTRSSSTADAERSWCTTAPAAIGVPAGCAGGVSDTYFCPNSVLGSIDADTLAGIRGTEPGSSATVSRAVRPSAAMSRTWPTTTPRSFTSAWRSSCSPVWSVTTVTVTAGVNTCRYAPTDTASSAATSRMKHSPRNARPPEPHGFAAGHTVTRVSPTRSPSGCLGSTRTTTLRCV
nr:hypothetical protein [Actinocatenispora sera]